MFAMRVKPHNQKTFKLSVLITGPMNGDFDGDEINVFFPIEKEAQY